MRPVFASPAWAHDSRGSAKGVRYTLLPWFVKAEDDSVLEGSQSGNRDEFATAHCNMQPACNTPSGLSNIYGPFPICLERYQQIVINQPVWHVPAGRMVWTMGAVKVQRALLRDGRREEQVRDLIKATWMQGRRTTVAAWKMFEAKKRMHYEIKSFFCFRLHNLGSPSEENSSSLLS